MSNVGFGDSESMPAWRIWGEKKEESIVYTVYLKKIKYHTPLKTAFANDDKISHLDWETLQVKLVKAATLEKLIDSLVSETGELESSFINIFLATYRTFASSRTVLHLIFERFHRLENDKDSLDASFYNSYKKNLRLVLHVWLDSYPEDFKNDPNFELLNELLEFCNQKLPETELTIKVKHKFDKFKKEPTENLMNSFGRIVFESDLNCSSALSNELSDCDNLVTTFLELPEKHIAEQLTRIDTELFRKVVPHQCLGAAWSRRDRDRSRSGSRASSRGPRSTNSLDVSSVAATIDQFNAVSYRVISTILMNSELKPSQRAKIVGKWIDVAQELRMLKNFSSLKAIISGLQSNPIFRLKHVWAAVPREKVEVYEELARLFSEENNQSAQRELLIREGTAKFAETVGENDRQIVKAIQKQASNSAISFGTIPYLGTFLTDLTMIDTAMQDTLYDGLINFDKRRKEFEVLAQIKLLQGATKAYHFTTDQTFHRWFDSLLVIDEKEAYDLSCQIEVHRNSVSADRRKKQHRKSASIASTSSQSSSPHHSEGDTLSTENKLFPRLSSSSSTSSIPSLESSMASGNASSLNDSSTKTPASITPKPEECFIIRVSVESQSNEIEGLNVYKGVLVRNSDRTQQVIRAAMTKHDLNGIPEDYCLVQLLPKGEMALPPNANVYYAVNTSVPLNFVLRKKTDMKSAQTTPVTISSPSLQRVKLPKDEKGTVKVKKKLMALGNNIGSPMN